MQHETGKNKYEGTKTGISVGGGDLPKTERKPDWLKARYSCCPEVESIRRILRDNRLHTVCEEATCPNIGECFRQGTATFLILGDTCTRNCPFCDVNRAGHFRDVVADLPSG